MTRVFRSVMVCGLLAMSGMATASDLLACGDKYLVPGRGTRFQRPPQFRNAGVLIYGRNGAPPAALANLQVPAVLTRAGFKVTSVGSPSEIDQALRQGSVDVVVADVAEMAAIRSTLPAGAEVAVLPVLRTPTPTELSQAKSAFPVVLKAPAKAESLLEAIDDVLDAHAKNLAKAAKAAKAAKK